ncbi:hypothetical protein F5X96DRAFT_679803 [Biscogniauxia mediterranea]|nr:hypothetical protein F5X96DRAFT_679803 [Biscogniauxia mediterranea]
MFLLHIPKGPRPAVLSSLRCPGARTLSSIASTDDSSQSNPPVPRRYSRLSSFWLASGGITAAEKEDSHAKLIRAGYLRQSHAGIFHMLPLGQRVQEKLEKLIDKYMLQLGASKVSLSSISSQALWQKTNRLEGYGPELFRFDDRKQVPYLLAPTHEEEITNLVARSLNSYKSLPLRLYQIGRKYRDEIRPRHGVLRSREFVMKDLYTFDYSVASAMSTYDQVREGYSQLFDELKLPYLVAEASSGDIGGDLSHEYHLPTPIGEDNVISCNSCNYVANEELAATRVESPGDVIITETQGVNTPLEKLQVAHVWRGVSKDRKSLINVWYPSSYSEADVNTHFIKSILPDLDSSLEDPSAVWEHTLSLAAASQSGKSLKSFNLIDYRLGPQFIDAVKDGGDQLLLTSKYGNIGTTTLASEYITSASDGTLLNTVRIRDGDSCPKCESGKLKVQRAIELGHTFHLGTRYSEPLNANVQVPLSLLEEQPDPTKKGSTKSVALQMGCHGIGVSRIIGAVADHLSDEKGLNWPRAIAPFEVVVIPGNGLTKDATEIANYLTDHRDQTDAQASTTPIDLVLDDRPDSFPWKLKDADLVGYPVIVIVGKRWTSEGICEVQCRRLAVTSHVSYKELPAHINGLLSQL